MSIPDAEVETLTKIVLSATDKNLLGLFSVRVREYRKPEPYKGEVCFFSVSSSSVLTPCRAYLSVQRPYASRV